MLPKLGFRANARAKILKPPKTQGRKMPQTRYSSQDRVSNFEEQLPKNVAETVVSRACKPKKSASRKITDFFFKNTILRCPTHRRESLRNAGFKHEKHQNMGNNPRQNKAPWPTPTTTTTTAATATATATATTTATTTSRLENAVVQGV